MWKGEKRLWREPFIIHQLGAASVFALSGLVGVWAAFAPTSAWPRWGLLVAGLLLASGVAWSGRHIGRRALVIVSVACGLAVAAISVLSMLSQIVVPSLDLSADAVAEDLAMLIPVGLAGFVWAWMHRRKGLAVLMAFALSLGLVALGMGRSLGAGIGLVCGLGLGGWLYWRPGLSSHVLRRTGDGLIAAAGLCLLGGFLLLLVQDMSRLYDGIPLLDSRVQAWRTGIALVQDYPFTGSGLASTGMVASSYVLLVHVPFQSQVHSLYLQIAIEQGLFGLVAFLWMVAVAGVNLVTVDASSQSMRIFRAGAAAGLVALVFHGLVEADAYVTVLSPALFVPVGFAGAVVLASRRPAPRAGVQRLHVGRAITGFAALVLAGVFLALLPGIRSLAQSNLGAVAQSRAELAVYRWPDWPIQDEVRRAGAVDLEPAIAYYQAALGLEPRNVTANRRLGQIELSLGQYDAARTHLEAAYQVAPGQRATRQMLGEVYAVTGQTEQAVALLQTVDIDQNQLDIRVWWYEHIQAFTEAERLRAVLSRVQAD
jgi:O-antigen ligase